MIAVLCITYHLYGNKIIRLDLTWWWCICIEVLIEILIDNTYFPAATRHNLNGTCTLRNTSTHITYRTNIEGILPKGPYLPCVSMAGRALLAWYHRYKRYIFFYQNSSLCVLHIFTLSHDGMSYHDYESSQVYTMALRYPWITTAQYD